MYGYYSGSKDRRHYCGKRGIRRIRRGPVERDRRGCETRRIATSGHVTI